MAEDRMMAAGSSGRRGRAERRKNSICKALRKQAICRSAYGFEWYRRAGLHAYSKGKIHCSCPMCSYKTRGNVVKKQGLSECRMISDARKIADMQDQEKEIQGGWCSG